MHTGVVVKRDLGAFNLESTANQVHSKVHKMFRVIGETQIKPYPI